MDTRFENRFSTTGDLLLKSELTKILKSNALLDLSKIVLDYEISNEERQNLLFKDVSDIKIIWEYIWLTVKCKRFFEDNDSEIFNSDEKATSFGSLCSYYNEHSSFNEEHKNALFELLHLFMIADGFTGPAPHEAESAEIEAPKADHVNLMDMEVTNPVEGFVDIDRSPTEVLMHNIIDTGDIFCSKFNIPAFPDLEEGKILDKVNMVAGSKINRQKVWLNPLKFSDEMRTTEWVERSKKGFEPKTPLPDKIENLLIPRPVMICEAFSCLHPKSIDMETEHIHPAAHMYVDQITQSETFKDWMKNLFYNKATYPGNTPEVPIKPTLPEHEPGLVDKLLELWKLYGSIHKVKSEIISTGKSRGVITKVAPLTTKRRWSSLIYENQFASRIKEIERTVEVQLSKVQYDNMIMTYNLLKICFDRQYDTLVNYTLWTEFLEPLLKGSRHNQMVIILLIRALANSINKEIWRAFLDKKSEVQAVWEKTRNKKEKIKLKLNN